MPNDVVAPRSRAIAKPAAARSRASSQVAGRSPPLSLTRGSVNRTCLLIECTFRTNNRYTGNKSMLVTDLRAGLWWQLTERQQGNWRSGQHHQATNRGKVAARAPAVRYPVRRLAEGQVGVRADGATASVADYSP